MVGVARRVVVVAADTVVIAGELLVLVATIVSVDRSNGQSESDLMYGTCGYNSQ